MMLVEEAGRVGGWWDEKSNGLDVGPGKGTRALGNVLGSKKRLSTSEFVLSWNGNETSVNVKLLYSTEILSIVFLNPQQEPLDTAIEWKPSVRIVQQFLWEIAETPQRHREEAPEKQTVAWGVCAVLVFHQDDFHRNSSALKASPCVHPWHVLYLCACNAHRHFRLCERYV